MSLYTRGEVSGGFPNGNKETHHLALTTLKRVRSSALASAAPSMQLQALLGFAKRY
jgi:hypothetical protein